MTEEIGNEELAPHERTPEQELLDSISPEEVDFNSDQYGQFLEGLFRFGTVPPKVFNLGKNFKVKLQILTPAENLEVTKKIDQLPGNLSKEKTLILETLSRAILSVNNYPIRFDEKMIAEWKEFRNTTTEPTLIEQQRFILTHRFQQGVLELTYSKYRELAKEQAEAILSLKKNSED